MSKLKGGIFSKPSGQTAGLVFGAARTRTGKVATVRQLVPPSNPDSPAQRTQRNKFKEALAIVRAIGASVYKDDFNRSISQLPGFQSLMSIITNSLTDSLEMLPPAPTNLGTLHFPDSVTTGSGLANFVTLDFSSESGANGAGSDRATLIAIAKNPATSAQARPVFVSQNAGVRELGEASVNVGVPNTDFVACLYFTGSDVYSGLLSQARWLETISS